MKRRRKKREGGGGRRRRLSPKMEPADKNIWIGKIRKGANIGANPAKGGMTNRLVDKLTSMKCGNAFGGVYSADRIPPQFAARKKFVITVNLGKKSEPVGHFVTVVGRPTYIKYIDPYGLPPFQPDLKTFLDACNRPIRHSDSQIQSVLSKNCGLFSILFACRAANKHGGKKLLFALGGSQKELEENDRRCIKYLSQIYR